MMCHWWTCKVASFAFGEETDASVFYVLLAENEKALQSKTLRIQKEVSLQMVVFLLIVKLFTWCWTPWEQVFHKFINAQLYNVNITYSIYISNNCLTISTWLFLYDVCTRHQAKRLWLFVYKMNIEVYDFSVWKSLKQAE